jgi:hypothetical protein
MFMESAEARETTPEAIAAIAARYGLENAETHGSR